MIKSVPVPQVVDGRWAWAVAVMGTFSMMLSTGTVLGLSILYVNWLESFKESKSMTSWIVSIAMACLLGIGPVAAYLFTVIGYRGVALIGAMMTSLSLVMASQATSVTLLIITVGIIAGCGRGFSYMFTLSVVSLHFDKRRSVALGLCCSGVGTGALLQSLLINYLQNIYGWRGCLLILAGLDLHQCIFVLLMCPAAIGIQVKEQKPSQNTVDLEKQHSAHNTLDYVEQYTSLNALDTEDMTSEQREGIHWQRMKTPFDIQGAVPCPTSSGNYPESLPLIKTTGNMKDRYVTLVRHCGNDLSVLKNVKSNSVESPCSQTISDNTDTRKELVQYCDCATEAERVIKPHNGRPSEKESSEIEQCEGSREIDIVELFSSYTREISNEGERRNDKFSQKEPLMEDKMADSSTYEPIHTTSMKPPSTEVATFTPSHTSSREVAILNPHTSELCKVSNQPNESNITLVVESIISDEANLPIRACLVNFFQSFVLLKQRSVLTICVSDVLTNLTFLMPVIYMVDRARELGIPTDTAAVLVSINGVGNLLGRISLASLASHPRFDPMALLSFSLATAGLITAASPLCGSNLIWHGVYALLFGWFIGGYVVLLTIAAVDIVGIEKSSHMFGLCGFFQGTSGAVGPPLAGLIYSWTGGFTLVYIAHGCFLVISASLLCPIIYQRYQLRKVAVVVKTENAEP